MKPRVVIVGPVPPPYHGITVSTQRILDSKLAEEFELIHLDTSDHRDMDNIGKIDFANASGALRQAFKCAWICATKRPDILYTTINANVAFLRDGLFILIGRWLGGAKVVIHLRGGTFTEFYDSSPWPVRRFVDLAMRRVERAIILGANMKNLFVRWLVPERIDIIPNGTPFHPGEEAINTSQRGRRPFVVAFLGNLIKEKGVVDTVKAAALLADKVGKIEFRFAGAWWSYDDAKPEIEALVGSDPRVKEAVKILGVLKGEEKERFLLDSDVLVFPTYYRGEGHPNVIIEAMAAGLPVIATDYVAISETVVDGVTGWLVPPRSPAVLADRIQTLILNPELRASMGKASRERFLANYTQEKNISDMAVSFRRTFCEQGSKTQGTGVCAA